jgi:hypothetical protein
MDLFTRILRRRPTVETVKLQTFPYERDDVPFDEDWERGRTPFVAQNVKGIQDWLLRLPYDGEMRFIRTKDRHGVWLKRHNTVARWYFKSDSQEGAGRWIHAWLLNPSEGEIHDVARRASNGATTNSKQISFNIHNEDDLILLKEFILRRMDLPLSLARDKR